MGAVRLGKLPREALMTSERKARLRICFVGGVAHVVSDPQPSVWQGIDDKGKLQERESAMTCAIVRRATAEEVRQWQMQ